MISLKIFMVDGRVEWHLAKYRPSKDMARLGVYAWERRGWVAPTDEPMNDRQAISAALRSVQDRLGERQD